MNELVAQVHSALNATAIPRSPDPATLPPRAAGSWRPLAAPGVPRAGLRETLTNRRSRYSFGTQQPGAPEIASLLLHGVGTAPRAGGLPSVVPYVVACRRGPIPAGVHEADLRYPLPGLVAVRDGDPAAYVEGTLEQPQFAGRVPLWIALTIDTSVAAGRYPARHYRTQHLDAGVALQNVLLVATAHGLATCPVMGYDDPAWGELLDLPDHVLVAGLVAVG